MLRNTRQLFFNRQPVSDFNSLVNLYGKKEFLSPCRSTVPLLTLVKHGQPILDNLLSECHLPVDTDLHFEFTIRPPCGRGCASHTDIMALTGKDALAIEFKWTEPRYKCVHKWLHQGTDQENRKNVLNGWGNLLKSYATRSLAAGDFGEAVYQMVHRAASACIHGVQPQLAYVIFTPAANGRKINDARIYEDLNHLRRLLGKPTNFPFHLFTIQLSPTAAFRAIELLPKGKPATGEIVRAALHGEPLFEFNYLQMQVID